MRADVAMLLDPFFLEHCANDLANEREYLIRPLLIFFNTRKLYINFIPEIKSFRKRIIFQFKICPQSV